MLARWTAMPEPFDQVFDDVMRNVFGTAASARGFSPHTDVRVSDDAILFLMDVPGVKREDLEVSLENRRLTIKGNRRFEEGKSNERLVLGRAYGSFTRTVALPEYLDYDGMTASLADGVLRVEIPRTQTARPRKVQIG